jgi:NAD(P)-dependent dehydrogenase (short-subunit alcohol dehydrogenase family)
VAHHLFDLAGRTALVTGGDRGLGFAMASALARYGARVVLVARDRERLHAAAERLRPEATAEIAVRAADLTDRTAIGDLVAEIERTIAPVDILLADAGVSEPQPVVEISDDAWDRTLAVNLSAAMACTRAVAPGMSARGWGRIIFISSTFGEVSMPGRAAYSASKSALRGLARGAALDLGAAGVTVNCIAPGPFLTEMTDRVAADESVRRRFADMTALGRWGDPSELAGPVLLLASDAGSYITGTTLFVDGGYTAR